MLAQGQADLRFVGRKRRPRQNGDLENGPCESRPLFPLRRDAKPMPHADIPNASYLRWRAKREPSGALAGRRRAQGGAGCRLAHKGCHWRGSARRRRQQRERALAPCTT
jgi:hypothetical protein